MSTVLVVNAGSSSLKLSLLDGSDRLLERTQLPANAFGVDRLALRDVFRIWPVPDVVGHRIVHGGTDFRSSVRITPAVEKRLRELVDLAPLHQPKSLAALAAVRAHLPEVDEIACFDTAFHATIGEAAATYAVPREWRTRWGLRRYGFHGLSHAYCKRHAARLAGHVDSGGLRIVTCHLGAGASLA
ncbi:MAG TPA: hypothetical protein VFP15_15100, partial [Gemmatimonadaceae bacterium]|nr:hypothetical protein [Gemmatimonadaceae bacterium]